MRSVVFSEPFSKAIVSAGSSVERRVIAEIVRDGNTADDREIIVRNRFIIKGKKLSLY